MKRALEFFLLVGVLARGAFVLHAWRLRRAAPANPLTSPSAAPGEDVENPDAPRPPARPQHSITELPTLKQNPPSIRRRVVVPPPPSKS
jgi:hypothetical protein